MRKGTKRFWRVAALIGLGWAAIGSASAQVLTLAPKIPLFVTSHDGSTADGGQVVEILQAAAQRAGLNLTVEIQPWARAYETAQTTKDVFLMPVSRSPEREALFEWVGPISKGEYRLYRLAQGPAPRVSALKQIGDATIGVLRGDAIAQYLKTQPGGPSFEGVAQYDNLVQMFLGGRFEYLAVVPLGFSEYLRQLKVPPATVEPLFTINGSPDPYSYLVLAKGSDPKLVVAMRQALEAMVKDGSWDKIYRSYE